MSKFWSMNRVLAGFMVMLLAGVLSAGGAEATLTRVPPTPAAVKQGVAALTGAINDATKSIITDLSSGNDTELGEQCDQNALMPQVEGNLSFNWRLENALRDSSRDQDTLERADKLNKTIDDIWFCPIKISMLTDIMGLISDISSLTWAAVWAFIKPILKQIVMQLLAQVCSMLVSAIAMALSYICIPNVELSFQLPSFQLPQFSGACTGTPLMSVQGGMPTPPPLNYNLGLPRTNYEGRINVFQ